MTTAAATPPDVSSRGETLIKAGLSLVPIVGGSLPVVVGDAIQRRKARAAAMAEAALDRYGKDQEEFLRRLQVDTKLADLFLKAVQAATETAVDEKARALGLLLGDALSSEDADSYDEKELLILALSDLEWPHIRGLQRLAAFPNDDEIDPEEQSSLRKQRLEATSSLPSPVLAALVRHGP